MPLTRVGGAPSRRRVCVAVYAPHTCVPARTATGNITFLPINFSPSERANERACEATSTRIWKTIMKLDGARKEVGEGIKSEWWGRIGKFLRLGDIHGWVCVEVLDCRVVDDGCIIEEWRNVLEH